MSEKDELARDMQSRLEQAQKASAKEKAYEAGERVQQVMQA